MGLWLNYYDPKWLISKRPLTDTLIKTKKPKFEQYYTVRSEIDEKRLVRKIHKVWEGINRGVFIPNDTSWKCPNCQYRQHCDEWFLKGGEL